MDCISVDDDASAGVCANCGKGSGGEGGTIKLKNCAACHLVKYCSVDCQKAHRKRHKSACKKRAAELKDEQLYSQGHERPEGDFCPICTLAIPLQMDEHSGFSACCMKRLCNGCNVASQARGMDECLFCRTPFPDSAAKMLALARTRVEKKDPVAINFLAVTYRDGKLGLQKSERKAVELWREAAELGSIEALHFLGYAFYEGKGVKVDKTKGVEFYKKAAMQGNVESRHNLGCHEGENGNYDRAVKHLSISSKMGFPDSLEKIKALFMAGIVTKEQYAQTLRGYQGAVEEMKSHDRDAANEIRKHGILYKWQT